MIYLYVAFSFIFGLIIGSFINCLIWRLHEKEGLWNRSYCPKCKHKISWYDNVPVLSFIFLLGKCRNCKEKISYQYPLIELLTAILFAVAFLIQFPISNFSLSEGSSTGENFLISGIIGGSFFLFQFVVSRGRWIGGGDIRLGLLMGFALGWPYILVAIFLAYFMGAIISVGLVAGGKKKWGSKIPLGIFLSTAAIITLFWGDEILNWYLGFILAY